MCKINTKTKHKTVTGYKAVFEIDGKYYSPSTGVEYVEGMKMPFLNKRCEFADTDWADIFEDTVFYHYGMQGKTGVFRKLSELKKQFSHNKRMRVIKITLTGEIYDGTWDGYLLYIGTEIKTILNTGRFTR